MRSQSRSSASGGRGYRANRFRLAGQMVRRSRPDRSWYRWAIRVRWRSSRVRWGRQPALDDRPQLSSRRILVGLGRRSLPHLLEATLIPTVLFYVLLVTIGPGVAMIGVLCWTFVAVAPVASCGTAIPSILLLATIGLSVRTLIGLVSGSTFAYFVQPIATTVVLSRQCSPDRCSSDDR